MFKRVLLLAQTLLAPGVLPEHPDQAVGVDSPLAWEGEHLCEPQVPGREVHVTGNAPQPDQHTWVTQARVSPQLGAETGHADVLGLE